jgi:hypothetical protein
MGLRVRSGRDRQAVAEVRIPAICRRFPSRRRNDCHPGSARHRADWRVVMEGMVTTDVSSPVGRLRLAATDGGACLVAFVDGRGRDPAQ